jgi:hypothetical protein
MKHFLKRGAGHNIPNSAPKFETHLTFPTLTVNSSCQKLLYLLYQGSDLLVVTLHTLKSFQSVNHYKEVFMDA